MEQRSEALRLASIRKKNQINEVQTAKDIQMKQQQDRIQKELIKSQKQEEAALQGLEKLRLKRIEQAKEKHEYERQRAQQNLEKSKQEFEQEQAQLEESINKKTARAELIKRERERTILLSKSRAKEAGAKRELLKKDLETFDDRARRAEIFANMIVPTQPL